MSDRNARFSGLIFSIAAVITLLSVFHVSNFAQERGRKPQPGNQVLRKAGSQKTPFKRGRAYRPDRVIVVYNDQVVSPASRQAMHASLGARVERSFQTIPGELVKLPRNLSTYEAIMYYQKMPGVRYAQPDYKYRANPVRKGAVISSSEMATAAAATVPNDPLFEKQWALSPEKGGESATINALDAWSKTTGSPEVVVAVIDTGVDYKHKDLKNQMWVNQAEKNGKKGEDDDGNGYVDDIYGYDFVNGDGDPLDDDSHGTHCSGIIAAEQNNGVGISGIAPGVRIMALKFLDDNGSGFTSDAIKCYEYAIKMGATLTSNSYGGGGEDTALYEAMSRFGGLCVIAAGNDYSNNDDVPCFPANNFLPNAVTVLSTNIKRKKSDFSNYGKRMVHIGAPGEDILSCVLKNKYQSYSGTSMATPLVAGVAALYLSEHPDSRPELVINRLMALGKKAKSITNKSISGNIVDAAGIFSEANTPPYLTSLSIAGKFEVKQSLRAHFQYTDQENDEQQGYEIKWYVKDRITGIERRLARNKTTVKPSANYGDRLIRFEVRAKAKSGATEGYPFSSPYSSPLESDWPIVYLLGSHSKSSHYVTLGGRAFTKNGSEILDYGVEYYPLGKAAMKKEMAVEATEGELVPAIAGLDPETAYKFRLFARNKKGTAYSSYHTVKTGVEKNKTHKLTPLKPARDNCMANDVRICGNLALVDGGWVAYWKVYRYDTDRDIWNFDGRIFPDWDDDFLWRATTNGEYVFAPGANSGNLVIYKKGENGWKKTQKIKKIDTFGSYGSAATENEVFIIDNMGSYLDTHIKVLRRKNNGKWKVAQKLSAPAGKKNALFGSVVDVYGDNLIISEGYNSKRDVAPTVYFYHRNKTSGKWVLVDSYTPVNQKKNCQDYDVTISDNYAVIGIWASYNQPFSGKALVFKRDPITGKWSKIQELRKVSQYNDIMFAEEVQLFQDKLFISATIVRDHMLLGYRLDANGRFVFDDSLSIYPDKYSWTLGRDDVFRNGDNMIVGDLNDGEVESCSGAAVIVPASSVR